MTPSTVVCTVYRASNHIRFHKISINAECLHVHLTGFYDPNVATENKNYLSVRISNFLDQSLNLPIEQDGGGGCILLMGVHTSGGGTSICNPDGYTPLGCTPGCTLPGCNHPLYAPQAHCFVGWMLPPALLHGGMDDPPRETHACENITSGNFVCRR